MGANSPTIVIRLSDVVGTDRDKPAIGNFKFTMEFDKAFSLAAVLGAVTAAAEDENQWVTSLQVRELAASRSMVSKLVVAEDRPWDDVRSHRKSSSWVRVAGLRLSC